MQEKIKDFRFGWRFLCVGCVSVISRSSVGGNMDATLGRSRLPYTPLPYSHAAA